MHELDERFDTLDKGFSETLALRPSSGRPAFLTVLCILTFVGAGLFLIVATFGLISNINGIKVSQELAKEFGDQQIAREIQSNLIYSIINQSVSVFGNLICIIGAILMWRLKRAGYYLYLVGQIAPLVSSLLFIGGSGLLDGTFGGFAFIGIMIGAFFPITFIIMYTVNYKHLR